MIPVLESRCYEFVKAQLNVENVIQYLNQAQDFDEEKIIEWCWEVIDQDAEKLVESESFKQLDHEFLCEIISRDSLCIEETRLILAVL